MPLDYGQKLDKIDIRSNSDAGIFLYRSGSLRDQSTSITSSLPGIIGVTCSANINNRLTSPLNKNAFGIITISSGSTSIRPIRLILSYVSSSIQRDVTGSALPSTEILNDTRNISYTSSNYTKDYIVNIPIKNNDDSYAIAYKTVNALSKKGGYTQLFSASLVNDGSNMGDLSSSVGSFKIGSSFKVRNSTSNDGSEGKFIIHSLKSGSTVSPTFRGTAPKLGEMKIGGSFKIGETNPVFSFNIIQSGSGIAGQEFYPGNFLNSSASLIVKLDPNDKTSAFISGSGGSVLYFSSSGNIGIGTTTPTKALDIKGDLNVEGNITAQNYIVSSSVTNITTQTL